jgi:hypothetical protein
MIHDPFQLKMVLSRRKEDAPMFPLSHDLLMFTIAGAIIALSAAVHSPFAETLAPWLF